MSVHCLDFRGMVKVSFIDYVSCLLDRDTESDHDVRLFHKLMCRRICFPSTLVANTRLAALTREEKRRQREMQRQDAK